MSKKNFQYFTVTIYKNGKEVETHKRLFESLNSIDSYLSYWCRSKERIEKLPENSYSYEYKIE